MADIKNTKYKKSVYRNLTIISQLAFSVITPILLCTYVGYLLDRQFGTRWITLVLLILGTISGGKLAYRQAKTFLKKETEEDKKLEEEKSDNVVKADTIKPKRRSRILGKEVNGDEKK